jgi:hypothetical protein
VEVVVAGVAAAGPDDAEVGVADHPWELDPALVRHL